MVPHVEFLPVCPEVEIGLGVPRDTIKIVRRDGSSRLIRPSDGSDLTGRMRRYSRDFLGRLDAVDGFLLKSRSPSCAMKDAKWYPRADECAAAGRGAGVFGQEVLERCAGLAVEDEARLNDPQIRGHFFTKLFALAEWRKTLADGRAAAWVRFHSRHKLLLMAYHQRCLAQMGRLAASARPDGAGRAMEDYDDLLKTALSRAPQPGRHVNVLHHVLGYFSDRLGARERAHVLRQISRYAAGRIGLTEPLSVFRAWVERFEHPYLSEQAYFEPFPEDLSEF